MDYRIYKFTGKELLKNILGIMGILLIIAKLFYGNCLYAIVISPFLIPALKIRRKQKKRKRQERLEIQFKDMLVAMADAMVAGASSVTAISESYKEMLSVHGYHSYICQELRTIMSRIKLNVPLESTFEDFAQRADIEEIALFASVFRIAQKRGGNMVQVIKNVADNIRQKSEVKEEIAVCINEKKFEERIMSVVPIIIVGYMHISSPGFLDIMYETWMGKIIMTICFVVYVVAFVWAEKMMNIEV